MESEDEKRLRLLTVRVVQAYGVQELQCAMSRDQHAELMHYVDALAAEVRALRRKVDVTCGYLSDRVELRWDDELIRVVTEWRDAAMASRGEDS